MIDDEQEVFYLIERINRQLPTRAYATPPLVQTIRDQGGDLKVGDPVEIDSVLYLGDEGGIACAIARSGDKSVVVTSITHLTFGEDHPLVEEIRAYQIRRSQRLAGTALRGSKSKRSRGSLEAKSKRKRVRVVPKKKVAKSDLDRRFRAAIRLWRFGKYERAADAFRKVLNLNPNDPQFFRYYLLSCLFQMDSTEELDEVLQRHDDQSGIWRFAQSLQAFRRYGDTEETQRLLVEADHLEPGFEDYLLRDKVVDASRDVRFDSGGDERAFGCARLFLPAWRGTPGAASWARRVLKAPVAGVESDRISRRYPLNDLRTLPQRRETWQVGLMPSPDESSDDGPPMWLLGVANVKGQEVRTVTVIDQPLTETVAWNPLIEAFVNPMEGEPARPTTLIVGLPEFCDAWKPLLARIGIGCRYERDPQPVGQLLEAMGHVIERPAVIPTEEIDIREFPQSEAVWQADFLRSPAWVMNESEGTYRPWSVLVLDKSRSNALQISNAPHDPTPEMLLEVLVHTMAQPRGEPPQRPRLIELSDSDCYDHLRPRLEAAGVDCRLVDELAEFNEFCLELARSCDGSGKCALADGRGVKRPQMESFYDAAAYYFREAPWRRVPGEAPIEIRCDHPDLGTRYAIVLGRTGVQLGLCVYDDWKTTQRMLSGFANPDENRALAVCYDEPQIMAAVDLQLIERLGWPIATPEAWPAVMRLQPHRTPRSPSGNELVFLDACLRAIPDFVKLQTASQHRKVATETCAVELHLAWKSGHSAGDVTKRSD